MVFFQRSAPTRLANTRRTAAALRHRPLRVEPLEDRCLLSWALDPTFTTPGYPPGHVFFSDLGEPSSMALQPDHKIVMAGFTGETTGNTNFSIVRFLPNGQPDPGFGVGGEVNFSFYDNAGADVAYSMVIQPWDGKIVLAGQASPGGSVGNLGYVFALARFNPDGTPDLSFGGVNGDDPGKVTISFSNNSGHMVTGRAYALALLDNHQIIVGGTADFNTNPTTGEWFALARLNPDGTTDPAFGTGGEVLLQARDNDEIHGLLVLPDDGNGQKIVFCGQDLIAPGAGNNMAVGRLLPDGQPDPSFAVDSPYTGIRLISFGIGHNDGATAIIRQPADGKLVVIGSTQYFSQFGDFLGDFAAARLTPDGDLDSSGFGSGGKVTVDIGYSDIAYDVALQTMGPDTGKLVLGGYTLFQDGPISFSGARLFPDGAVEQTFVYNWPNSFGHGDQIRSLVVQPWDDRILAGGFHTDPTTSGPAVVRMCADPRACSVAISAQRAMPGPPAPPAPASRARQETMVTAPRTLSDRAAAVLPRTPPSPLVTAGVARADVAVGGSGVAGGPPGQRSGLKARRGLEVAAATDVLWQGAMLTTPLANPVSPEPSARTGHSMHR
jgi:uncharacterized delta-60 repeat protein